MTVSSGPAPPERLPGASAPDVAFVLIGRGNTDAVHIGIFRDLLNAESSQTWWSGALSARSKQRGGLRPRSRPSYKDSEVVEFDAGNLGDDAASRVRMTV